MRLVLASSSPRRREILDMFNADYEVTTTNIEDNLSLNSSPSINAMTSAFMKANAVFNQYEDKEDLVVVGADTIVVMGQYQFGKPKDEDDEINTLKFLSDKTHEVITGYAIVKNNYKYVNYAVSTVKFKKLDDEIIKKYVATKEGLDKAGSYAIQGMSSVFIDYVKGDLFNIIGLPISDIYYVLKDKFSIDLLDFHNKKDKEHEDDNLLNRLGNKISNTILK